MNRIYSKVKSKYNNLDGITNVIIGNIYDLSNERIRQLEKIATNKLRYRSTRIKAKVTLEKVYNYITNDLLGFLSFYRVCLYFCDIRV